MATPNAQQPSREIKRPVCPNCGGAMRLFPYETTTTSGGGFFFECKTRDAKAVVPPKKAASVVDQTTDQPTTRSNAPARAAARARGQRRGPLGRPLRRARPLPQGRILARNPVIVPLGPRNKGRDHEEAMACCPRWSLHKRH